MRNHRAHYPQQSGFSLIELMVVVAMIMVLMSLLAPSLIHGKDGAIQAACAGKMRSIGVGLHSYMSDTGRYPLSAWLVGTGGDQFANITWAEALYPHMYNRAPATSRQSAGSEFSCPGVTLQRNRLGYIPLSYQVNAGHYHKGDYAANPAGRVSAGLAGVALEQDRWTVKVDPLRAGDVQGPAGTLFLVDGRESTYPYTDENAYQLRDATYVSASSHRLLNNFLFCDGHVRLMDKRETVGKPINMTAPRGMWSPSTGD